MDPRVTASGKYFHGVCFDGFFLGMDGWTGDSYHKGLAMLG